MKWYNLNSERNEFCEIAEEQSSIRGNQTIYQKEDFQSENRQLQTVPVLTWDQIGSPIKLSTSLIDQSQIPQTPDATLLWTFMSPGNFVLRRNPVLIIKKGYYVIPITNMVELDYAVNYYVCIDGINGMADANGNPTSRVARFQLRSIVMGQITTQIMTTIVYQLVQDALCEIPPTVTQLNFRIEFDTTTGPFTLPLPAPIGLAVEIHKFYNYSFREKDYMEQPRIQLGI